MSLRAAVLPYEVFYGESVAVRERFDEACDWLRSLNLFPNGNRYMSYRKSLARLSYGDRSSLDEAKLQEYVAALGEAGDLVRIRRAFGCTESVEFLARLKEITSGQPFQRNVLNDPGRDVVFELSVASRFLEGQYEVQLTGLADLTAVVDGRKVFVECKRVKSASKALARSAEAARQIQKRLKVDASSRSRGLAVICLTDILSPTARRYEFSSAQRFQAVCDDLLNDHIQRRKSDLLKQIGKRQIGVMLENSVYGITYDNPNDEKEPAFTFCRGGTLVYQTASPHEDDFTKALATRLCNHPFSGRESI
ncbi:hypothetical protein SAMN05443580_12091 [Variovorax sp. OV084]|nr:hypothetical protein SAMN05443580_12091 [Variovorax sp. OV084]